MLLKTRIHLLFAFLLSITGCKKEQTLNQPHTFYKEVINADDRKAVTEEEAKTYHEDTTYQYEYRTGTTGNYEYNYDVTGYDAEGNLVEGNINVKGKYGAGILTNTDNQEIEIETEWISYGILKAVDEQGNEYELEAE